LFGVAFFFSCSVLFGLVSVSGGLHGLGRAEGVLLASGHHSRFVQSFLLLAGAAPPLGSLRVSGGN
jgi:hypothetical protein